jgi:hypothetical protein
MQPLNYCRQLIKAAIDDPEFASIAEVVKLAVKFCLPDSGIVFEDPDLRGLDGGIELCLPFDRVALEFTELREPKPGEMRSSKRVIIAEQTEEKIECMTAIWMDSSHKWVPYISFSLPRSGYLLSMDGVRQMRIYCDDKNIHDIAQEAEVLLNFINALQCSNVEIAKTEGRKKTVKHVKDALPFDDYHFLAIKQQDSAPESAGHGGTHRSPREHLRRGHIRRLQTGKKIWVSATVVCAGRGGKVSKDYLMALDTAKVHP